MTLIKIFIYFILGVAAGYLTAYILEMFRGEVIIDLDIDDLEDTE